MKTTRIILAALSLAAMGLAPSAYANVPVIDLGNIAQAVKLVEASAQQLNQLQTITGINTEQLQNLKGISTAIGDAQKVAGFGERFSPAQLGNMLKRVPGMEGVDLNSVFKSSGALDLFSKIPINQWDKVISEPRNYYGQMLTSTAIRSVGQDSGLNTREIMFIDQLKRQDGRFVNASRASRDLAVIMMNRWEEEAKDRREKLQIMAETSSMLTKEAAKGETLIEQAAGATTVLNNMNQTNLEIASQANEAAGNQVKAIQAGNEVLEETLELERIRQRARGIRDK